MTVETKTTIHLSDIATVEIECRDCHRTVITPLDKAKNPQTFCDCNGKNWMPEGGDTYQRLRKLWSLMQQYAEANNEPFVMRFGLKPSASEAHAASEKD